MQQRIKLYIFRIVHQKICLESIFLDLPNGVSTEIEYHTGVIFLCRMDGAVFNLTDKIIEMYSTQTQNAFSTTPMFSHDTSSPTSKSIPTMNSSPVTGT